jgi:hypothetical protein
MNENGPFGGAVAIFGLPYSPKAEPHITLTTLARALHKSSLLRHPGKKIEFSFRQPLLDLSGEASYAFKRIEHCYKLIFDHLSATFSKEWKLRKASRIFNNNAVAIHTYFISGYLARHGPPNADDLAGIGQEIRNALKSYGDFWERELEADEGRGESEEGQRLATILSSEGTREKFSRQAVEFVLGRLGVEISESDLV